MSASPEVTPEAIDDGFAPERVATVHAVEIDGEVVLLNEGRLHLLNATGALVWACFDGSGTIAEIAADISDVLGVPYEAVVDDTLAIARELGGEGLLEGVTPQHQGELGADEPPSQWSSDPRFVAEPPNT